MPGKRDDLGAWTHDGVCDRCKHAEGLYRSKAGGTVYFMYCDACSRTLPEWVQANLQRLG